MRAPAIALLVAFAAAPSAAVQPPSVTARQIAEAGYILEVSIVSVGVGAVAGQRTTCTITARALQVERAAKPLAPGDLLDLAVPCFGPTADLPTCSFSIPAAGLVPGLRFRAAFRDTGLIGRRLEMVPFSYRALPAPDGPGGEKTGRSS